MSDIRAKATTWKGHPKFWWAVLPLLLITVMALWPALLVAPSPATHDPLDCSLRAEDGSLQNRLPPSASHWFGTDIQGCDYYARVIYGARTSLVIGLGAALFSTMIGLVLGGFGAFKGGWVDGVASRLGDIFFSIPYLVGAILLLALLTNEGRGPAHIIIAVGVLTWPLAARIVRSSVLQEQRQYYVEAARALGVSNRRLLWRHVMPNALAPIMVFTIITIGVDIGVEATLTYLGVGLQSPAISWGLMIASASGYMYDTPHLLLFPAFFVTLAVISCLTAADLVRDVSDPRLR